MEFNLASYFNSFDIDKDYEINVPDIASTIESLIESLANNPEVITTNEDLLEELIEVTHGFKELPSKQQQQLAYLIVSSVNIIAQQYAQLLKEEDFHESLDQVKSTMERYGYLMFVLLKQLGKEDFSQIGVAKTKNSVPKELRAKWESNCTEVENGLVAVKTILNLELNKIFVTSPEKDAFIELFSRPIINFLESPERMKIEGLKLLIIEDLCIAVSDHGHGKILKHSLVQCLAFYSHLPQFVAQFLNKLSAKYDHTQLTEEILREIAQTRFNANDTNGPKAFADFLVKLSELSPLLILRQMTSISQLLSNTNQSLRCAVIESCGNVVVSIIKNMQKSMDDEDDLTRNNNQQLDKLLDLLQERFLDGNTFVRCKAYQSFTKIAELKVKMNARRKKIMKLAVRALDDKSGFVRRNAIKLIGKLIMNHQFQGVHGTQLNLSFWKEKLVEAEADVERYLPKVSSQSNANEEVDEILDHDEVQMDISSVSLGKEKNTNNSNDDINNDNDDYDNEINEDNANDPNQDDINENSFQSIVDKLPDRAVLARVKLKLEFYKDAVEFIELIHNGVSVVSKLLFSKNKNESIDSMDFLVLTDVYGIENSQDGIRKMLHLVWIKGSSEEGKSVASHLIDCYVTLFLTAPSGTNLEKATHVAKNLIELTYDASLADLASLEKLLGLIYENKFKNSEVIQVLWQVYSAQVDDESKVRKQRRGAIQVLAMLALEDPTIMKQGLSSLLNIGLGEKGKSDYELCRCTCIALKRFPTFIRGNASGKTEEEIKAVGKLVDTLKLYTTNPEWFSVAEQALNAIFKISSDPALVCSTLIQEKSKKVFLMDDEESKSMSLSQLLFLVGHIAIKSIVYLENLEGQFKKKKLATEAKDTQANEEDGEENPDNELEMIGGTSEDDFADAIIHVKEREFLYGETSILKGFGQLVRNICSNLNQYNNTLLQRQATLCLVKLMCISSIYCEENLPMLLKIMEESKDPIIRCNCVLGLGDLAVSFNRLIDENTDNIYRRLSDEDLTVQKTCLMTVTFLILAGQVKVKGQLSSMAKCLEHSDQSISDMCKLFFAELATKDNAIYNSFIDIFSGLSFDENLEQEEFKRIMKFLVGFVEKERHQKQLSEKLLARLSKVKNEKEWKDVAFVLENIGNNKNNETITETLKEGYQIVEAK
ncbi:cnd1 [Candida pseudojiufengensis]|uniref:cnd1 n=1 Tax=Candida pseudojiufengensis TaxID=497109 RepID=UPI002225025D|nr:cnd1 [Candida pseudojiufengensis]KAI5965222.1 cnd1 [Candida pseudojiufengensis]